MQGIANESREYSLCLCVWVCVCEGCACVRVCVRVRAVVRLKRFTFTATFTPHSNYARVIFFVESGEGNVVGDGE